MWSRQAQFQEYSGISLRSKCFQSRNVPWGTCPCRENSGEHFGTDEHVSEQWFAGNIACHLFVAKVHINET